MSTASDAKVIKTYELGLLSNRATYATAALVFYDHLITFKYEIEFLWRRKWSTSTWIFVYNRYSVIAEILFEVVPIDSQICDDRPLLNTLFFFFVGELSSLPFHAFTILRAYALLQDHSWRLQATWTLVTLALTAVVLDSYQDFKLTWVHVDDPILGSGCAETGYSVSLDIINHVSMAAAGLSIISALFVLVITLMKTARQVHQASPLELKITLSEVLLRDGSAFFLIALIQVLMGAIFTADGSLADGNIGFILEPLFNVLPHILLSHFIINLRQVDSHGINTSTYHRSSHFSMPHFRVPTMDEIVSNLGEPLEFMESDSSDEDDATHEDTAVNGNTEQPDVTGTSWSTGVADVEAAGVTGSGRGFAETNILLKNSESSGKLGSIL